MRDMSYTARKIFNELVEGTTINYTAIRSASVYGDATTSLLDLHSGSTYTLQKGMVHKVDPDFDSDGKLISFTAPTLVVRGPEYEALISYAAYLDLSQKSQSEG